MYVPNRIWSYALRIVATVCFLQGVLIITESFLKPKIIKQICVAKEKDFSERTELYSYRLNFEIGHQYVDSDVYNAIMIGDSVLFRCTPLHYQIVEFIFPGNIKIKNVQNYYAQIGFGVFFLIMGGVLLFFKFIKQEHLIIWSFLIGLVLIFVITDLGHVLRGNPYGYSHEKKIKSEIKKNISTEEEAVSDSSIEDDLMVKIINKEIKTPMDQLLAKRCLDFMKTNYSLMNKIIDDPISLSNKGSELAMANYVICINSLELLEKSKDSVTNKMKTEIQDLKYKLELVEPRILRLYENTQK
jgi:hypothetical protein